jgi:hypothetical protein
VNDEPCDSCKRDRIRIGVVSAVVGAVITAAGIYGALKVRP